MNKISRGLIGLVVIFLTLIFGGLIGAWFGGNYAENFQFNGVRGYEATGQIGLICGSLVLFFLGVYNWVKKNS